MWIFMENRGGEIGNNNASSLALLHKGQPTAVLVMEYTQTERTLQKRK